MDRGQQIADRVRAAAADGAPLVIRGGGSKAWYGDPVAGEVLDVSDHAGVIEYDPGELVLTASGLCTIDRRGQLGAIDGLPARRLTCFVTEIPICCLLRDDDGRN
mgnify:CR=1 FL=1